MPAASVWGLLVVGPGNHWSEQRNERRKFRSPDESNVIAVRSAEDVERPGL